MGPATARSGSGAAGRISLGSGLRPRTPPHPGAPSGSEFRCIGFEIRCIGFEFRPTGSDFRPTGSSSRLAGVDATSAPVNPARGAPESAFAGNRPSAASGCEAGGARIDAVPRILAGRAIGPQL